MKHIQTWGYWSRPTWVFSPFNMITMANHGLCVVRLVGNRCSKAYNAPFCTIQNVSLYNEPVVLTINWWPHPHPLTVVLSKQCMVSNGLRQKYQQNICRRQPSPRLVAWDHWRWSSSIRPFQSCPSLDDTLAEKGFFLRLEKDRKLCFWKSIEKWNPVENSCHFCFFIFYESYCNLLQLGTRRLCFCS